MINACKFIASSNWSENKLNFRYFSPATLHKVVRKFFAFQSINAKEIRSSCERNPNPSQFKINLDCESRRHRQKNGTLSQTFPLLLPLSFFLQGSHAFTCHQSHSTRLGVAKRLLPLKGANLFHGNDSSFKFAASIRGQARLGHWLKFEKMGTKTSHEIIFLHSELALRWKTSEKKSKQANLNKYKTNTQFSCWFRNLLRFTPGWLSTFHSALEHSANDLGFAFLVDPRARWIQMLNGVNVSRALVKVTSTHKWRKVFSDAFWWTFALKVDAAVIALSEFHFVITQFPMCRRRQKYGREHAKELGRLN